MNSKETPIESALHPPTQRLILEVAFFFKNKFKNFFKKKHTHTIQSIY
jgi:hypothetical protein